MNSRRRNWRWAKQVYIQKSIYITKFHRKRSSGYERGPRLEVCPRPETSDVAAAITKEPGYVKDHVFYENQIQYIQQTCHSQIWQMFSDNLLFLLFVHIYHSKWYRGAWRICYRRSRNWWMRKSFRLQTQRDLISVFWVQFFFKFICDHSTLVFGLCCQILFKNVSK